MYYGKGSFTFHDLYSMPVYLRRWYLQKLSSTYEEESKQLQKQHTGGLPLPGRAAEAQAHNRIGPLGTLVAKYAL